MLNMWLKDLAKHNTKTQKREKTARMALSKGNKRHTPLVLYLKTLVNLFACFHNKQFG